MEETMEMMQETSASEEVEENLSEDFDDVEWESDEDATAEETSATDSSDADNAEDNTEQKEAEQQQETSAEEMFPEELVVFGEKRQVTMSEARELIQKGLGFDRAKANWEQALSKANSDPRIAFVDELAKAAGIDVGEYMSRTRNQMQYASLLEQYGSIDDVPETVMKLFTENANAAKEKAEREAAAIKAEQQAAESEAEYYSFMENHPEVGNIPQEVLALKVQGHSLEGAYGIWRAKELEAENHKLSQEIKTLKQNYKNRKTALPSTESKGAANGDDLEWV